MKYQLTTRHGKMSIAHGNDYISQKLLQTGEYEWYVIEILKQFSQGHTDGVILDIGANMGTVTISMAGMFPNYTVHSFEVQPAMIETLNENIKLNDLSNVVVHPHGLGEAVKTVEIQLPNYDNATNLGAFSLNPTVLQHSDIAKGHGEKVSIDIVPLDTINFTSPIRCIKMDVEGYEQQVLEGAVNTLKQHNYPPIIYELWNYNPWWREHADKLNQFLTDLGYELTSVDDTGIARHP